MQSGLISGCIVIAVGGCTPHVEEDAGNEQFDWLEVQLDQFRERGMQVRKNK